MSCIEDPWKINIFQIEGLDWAKMAFWQENYAFIKEVFDKRSEKMVELMDKADKAITEVHADKIYTSNEFKKVKENFTVGVWTP